MPVTDDPELKHLFDLLRMLPSPRGNREFYSKIQSRRIGTRDENSTYAIQKISTIWQVIEDPSPQNIVYLARYLMLFFAGENEQLWKNLITIFHGELSLDDDEPGRWWASDVSQTAWKLYVRYIAPHNDDWIEKWRYQDSWLDYFESESD